MGLRVQQWAVFYSVCSLTPSGMERCGCLKKDNTVSLVSFYSEGNLTYDTGEEGWIFLVVQGIREDTETFQLALRITPVSDGEHRLTGEVWV